jgi:hypothetical protein
MENDCDELAVGGEGVTLQHIRIGDARRLRQASMMGIQTSITYQQGL